MTNHDSMLEALRHASNFIFGENLEIDFHGTDEEAEVLYRGEIKIQLSADGTAFRFTPKSAFSSVAYNCTIGIEPEDYAALLKPTADELPDVMFSAYVAKRDIKALAAKHPFATIGYVMQHFDINPE